MEEVVPNNINDCTWILTIQLVPISIQTAIFSSIQKYCRINEQIFGENGNFVRLTRPRYIFILISK